MGAKVPADLRVIEVLGNTFRVDQVGGWGVCGRFSGVLQQPLCACQRQADLGYQLGCHSPRHGRLGSPGSAWGSVHGCHIAVHKLHAAWGLHGACKRVGVVNAQSILTGESGSVEKHVAAVKDRKAVYQDKTCLMFSVRRPPLHLDSL